MLRISVIKSEIILFKRFLSTVIKSEFDDTENFLNVLTSELSTDIPKRDYKSPKYWNLYKSTPEHIDPILTTIVLFPGQGSQYVGMAKNLVDIPRAKHIFDVASEYLKRDILKLCLEGPEDKLNKTIHCQPAIYTASLAAMEALREKSPELIENCVATAGNSLGEISSLVFSGALTFEQGLHFVRIRAEHMQKACDEVPGGLLTVFMGPKTDLTKAIAAAKLYCYEKLSIDKPVCQVSTYLFSECKVIGGHVEALEFIQTFAKDFNIKATKRLPVNGAFHTPLMRNALSQCKHALTRIGNIKEPQINVMSNVSGTIHTSGNAIKRLLGQQVSYPVLWEQILMRLYMRPIDSVHPKTIEVGPGSSIGQTVRRVNAKALNNYMHFEV